MNPRDLKEAERIANELWNIHTGLIAQGKPGLHPDLRETRRLASAIKLFGAVTEVVKGTHSSRGAMQDLLATL
jgi:hypothetical protein